MGRPGWRGRPYNPRMGAPDDGDTGGADGPRDDPEGRARRALDALAAAEMGVWTWEPESGQLIWDDQIARLHGFDPEDFDGTLAAFVARIHPDDEPHLSAAIQRARATGGAFVVEFRVLRPDGTTAWIQGRGQAVMDADGTCVRVVGVDADTTLLRTTREQVGRTLEHIYDGVVIIDRQWQILYANAAALAILRRNADEFLGRRIEDVFTDVAGSCVR